MITTSVVFDHRARTKKGNEGPVEIRISVDRKSYYIQTGVMVLHDEFVGGTVVDREDSDELNERIRILCKKVNAVINEYLAKDMPLDMVTIRRRVFSGDVQRSGHAMIDWIAAQLPLLGHREGTMRHYQTLFLRLQQYEQLANWQDLSVENLYKWDAWLHQLRGWDGKTISDGGVYNYHKCMKAMVQRAVRMGVIATNPYDRLRGVFRRGDKETVEYLTEDEMQRIASLELVPGSQLDKARDLFVFQMWTGLAYSDAQNFDVRRYKLEDGVLTYVGERIKTGVNYVSRLLPPAVAILEKYGMQTPKIGNADYNHLLKGIGIAAGIHTPLHSHMARHSFATYMLNNDVSLDSVSVMLGHTNTVQTRRYAKTLAKTVKDDFDKIAEKMKNRQP